MTTSGITYRHVGEDSEGIEVTAAGMQKLLARGALEVDTHEYRTDVNVRWRPLRELAATAPPKVASVELVTGNHARIRCPYCDHQLRIDTRHRLAGCTAECNRCHARFVLPEAPPPLPPVARDEENGENERELVCPQCGAEHTWRWELEGRTVRCRGCRTMFVAEVPSGAEDDRSDAVRFMHQLQRSARDQKAQISSDRDDAVSYFFGGLGLVALAGIATWVSGEVIGTGMIVFYGLAIVGIGMAWRGFGAFSETISSRVRKIAGGGVLGVFVLAIAGTQLFAHLRTCDTPTSDPQTAEAPLREDDRAPTAATEPHESTDYAEPAPTATGGEVAPVQATAADAIAAKPQPATLETASQDWAPAAKPLDNLPMREGTEWTYRRTIHEGSLSYSPFFLNAEGMLGSNLTHGTWSGFAPEQETFTIRVQAVESPAAGVRIGSIATDDTGSLAWLPPVRITDRRLRISEVGKAFTVTFEGYFAPYESKGLGVGAWWATGPSVTNEVSVPSGTYERARAFTQKHEPNTYGPALTTRSWFAPFVGLVKYELLDADGILLMTVELITHKP